MFRAINKSCVFRLLQIDKCVNNKVTCRKFFNPLVLNLIEFEEDKQRWRHRAGRAKERFIGRVQEAVEKESRIFTEDIKALCYLADKDSEFKLAIQAVDRYLEFMKTSSFKTLSYKAAGTLLLSMLHTQKQDDIALSWFIDEYSNVNKLAKYRHCFLLMMDLMYECGRDEEVVSIMTLAEHITDNVYADLVTITMASLYRMNTAESLGQLDNMLSELCLNPIQLTARSALYASMLAYKQGDIDMAREILHLPMFEVCSRKLINCLPNVQILCYIELNRLDDAVDILKDAVIRFEKSANLFFPEVLIKLDTAVKASTDVRLKDEFRVVYEALRLGDFIYTVSLEDFMSAPVGFKEYEMLMTTANPVKFNKEQFAIDRRKLRTDKTLIQDVKSQLGKYTD